MSNSRVSILRANIIVASILFIITISPSVNAISCCRESTTEHSMDTIWTEITHGYIREDVMPWDIKFKNITHGWVLSQNESSFGDGIILFTNDSGYSWNLQVYRELMWFSRITFVETTVWITAQGGLFRSDTDGKTWEYLALGEDTDGFRGICFINDTVGWTGSNRGIYKTEDGGSSWDEITTWPFGDIPLDIHFTTEQNGWITGGYGIYHSVDGGITWVREHSKGGWRFSFISATDAWVVGDNMLAHMVDGENWIEQSRPTNEYSRPPYFTDILFLNKTHGWIGGSTPQIAHTQNGGVDWYKQSVAEDGRIYAIWFYNESLGWATGRDGRIFRTTIGSELGEFSWSTSTPTLVYGVGFAIIAVISISLVFVRYRRKHSVRFQAPVIE